MLELNSFNPEAAARLITEINEKAQDAGLRELLFDLMEHYGIQVTEHEGEDFRITSYNVCYTKLLRRECVRFPRRM